ncbi:ADP-ribosylation factor-binding protein GGA2 [Neophocaena asiaeorientalis asiaeorientalis]|uniref:ADP-ribosylation factor-binding protein GGA2 n=1 Tax=Neophocaena asiaeorientalis asiaeorientalis TaxID=1706337 RepID=A0A341BBJ4_NEOAA|nr:ADP-ribosylation factor-binding protein GGA2 [Neophocaena asiaeorientalis asiaeorientalis]
MELEIPILKEQIRYKATDPSMSEQDWSAIQNFCDQVNTDPSGSTHAPWLLAHKIQSPQEKEALYALTVLEVCVNHCGEKFHNEVAKFRFLNELIKVLSPKYLGSWTTEKVKGRVIEILFSWTVWFPEDIKIRDAYQMLKKQGIIKQDPKLPVDKILPPPSPWPKSSIFDADEEKSKLLTRLLKSNHPEDLQAANRLIKNLVKEEQEKSEKVSKRVSAVEEVRSHVKVLQEMLSMYRRPGQAPPDQAALQVVYERCEKLRPTLFRLASDTTDDDDALVLILFLCRNYIPQKNIPREVPPGTKSSPGWSWEAGPLASSPSSQNTPLAQVFVPLESVKPSNLPPLIVYDRNGFRILLHFSQTGAPGHPEVQVLLLTMMSTATQPVWDIMFQVAVPKSMRVKLQPASSSKLPAFSPLMPPAVISQMLLLDNPHKEPIRLRYKLTFNQGGQPFSEVGEVKDFPDLAVLGAA